jgi:hypothetical protein
MPEHHALVDIATTDDWVVLECPACPDVVMRVRHGDRPSIEHLFDAAAAQGITHSWSR